MAILWIFYQDVFGIISKKTKTFGDSANDSSIGKSWDLVYKHVLQDFNLDEYILARLLSRQRFDFKSIE